MPRTFATGEVLLGHGVMVFDGFNMFYIICFNAHFSDDWMKIGSNMAVWQNMGLVSVNVVVGQPTFGHLG